MTEHTRYPSDRWNEQDYKAESCTGTTFVHIPTPSPWLLSASHTVTTVSKILSPSVSPLKLSSPFPPVPNALVKNRNFCHKTISNLHKNTNITQKQANTIWNSASIVLVIVHISEYAGRYKPIDKLRIESVSITAVLPLHLFLLPQYYCDVCRRYRHYNGNIMVLSPLLHSSLLQRPEVDPHC